MRSTFSFNSTAFNCLDPRDYFINDSCFGDDVCQWLIAELGKAGYSTSAEPEQEDFGWYFEVQIDERPYTVIIGFQPNSPENGDCWHGWVEQHTGLLRRIFGRVRQDNSRGVVAIIMEILQACPETNNVLCEME